MSISSGYTIDLYCDCLDCDGRVHVGGKGYGEYVGETWGDCAKQARSAGWFISSDRSVCIAPGHKKLETCKKGGKNTAP